MSPKKRSTLQLDLKDLSSGSPAPLKKIVTVVAVSFCAFLGAFAVANTSLLPDDEDNSVTGNTKQAPTTNTHSEIAKAITSQVDRTQQLTSSITVSDSIDALLTPASAELNNPLGQDDLETSAIDAALSTDTSIPLNLFASAKPVSDAVERNQPELKQENEDGIDVNVVLISSQVSEQLVENKSPAEKQIKKETVEIAMHSKAVSTPSDKTNPAMVTASIATQSRPEASLDVNEDIFALALDPDNIEAFLETGNHNVTGIEPEATETASISFEQHVAEVRKNDTLSQIFSRFGLKAMEAMTIAKLKDAKPLLKIRPGEKINLQVNPQGQLEKLSYKVGTFATLEIVRDGDEYQIDSIRREPEVRLRSESATIWTSLLSAAQESDLSYNVVYELVSLFGWQVDFAKDIQSGNRFSIIYEELFLDDKKVADGQILAAELVTGNNTLRAIRHVDEEGYVDYFAPDGDGIKGSFLRTPIKFGRVSSKFSNKRFHPILKKWRAHKGVDYSAPMRTPIFSTGDGVVKYAANKKGYGRTVIIRHGDKFETLYAHMNHFAKGIKNGARVKQGDVIGYVGKTGWATGPHLHYEFRINGRHKNPLTVKLPKSAPIEKKYMTDFKQVAQNLVQELDKLQTIPIAQNEDQTNSATTGTVQ